MMFISSLLEVALCCDITVICRHNHVVSDTIFPSNELIWLYSLLYGPSLRREVFIYYKKNYNVICITKSVITITSKTKKTKLN